VPDSTRKPWWLYPNLLGLDAPLVAVAWLYVFAKTWRLGYHPWEAYVSLGLVVWVIYAFDRLLDASLMGEGNPAMEMRHRFHWRHRKWFRLALMVVVPLLLALVVLRMPMALYKHLIPGGVLVAGFFGLAMITSQEPERVSFTKNIIAGTAFAYGTAIVAHVYRYEFDLNDMVFSREFVCFAVLCIMNISAIGLWEHAARAPDREIAAADELSLTLPLILLGTAALACAVMDSELSTRPFYYAILTAAGLLYVLNRSRANFGIDALRVLADVAMLVPVLVFIAARR
jgi:energy-converting hydrogenase Eha subunit A